MTQRSQDDNDGDASFSPAVEQKKESREKFFKINSHIFLLFFDYCL
jgi:hypothetical protein